MNQTINFPIHLTHTQVDRGANLLARVFQHDPMMQFLVADTNRMLDRPVLFYRANIRMGHLYGEVHSLPAVEGIAVWLRPGKGDFTMGQFLRSGLVTATLMMGPKTVTRMIKTATFFETFKKEAICQPHWLLLFLGIDPARQGQGLGGCLIEPMLERADAEGMPCYLDSTNERNLTFYKRHGFRVAAHAQVPYGGPEVWAMIREPR